MVNFNENTHTYTDNESGEILISVTQLMEEQGLAPDYSNIPTNVLNKAADYGTFIHKEIENYLKHGIIGLSEELDNFIEYIKKNEITPLYSEYMVYWNGVAGTIDFIARKKNGNTVLVDFKTTSTLYKDVVTWQESLYSTIAEHFNHLLLIDEIEGWHFDKKTHKLKVVPLSRKKDNEVERLIYCHNNNIKFEPTPILDIESVGKIIEIEELIKHYENKLKEAKENAENMRCKLIESMQNNGVHKFDNDKLTITLVDSTDRKTFDSTRFKKEHADMYDSYTKITTTKPSIRIKFKEQKDE